MARRVRKSNQWLSGMGHLKSPVSNHGTSFQLSLALPVVIGDWVPLVFVAGAITDWLGLQRSLEATVDARDHRGFLGVLVF